MKKKIFALISSLALIFTLLPNAYADTFDYPAFVGKYLSAGATASNYAELNILTCTENSITVDFKFIKNDTQQLIYTLSPGTVDGDKATIPFGVSYADGQFVTNGTMDITLTDWCVEVSCDSPRQHLFDGTMKPQFVLNANGSGSGNILDNPNTSTSSDVSVILNGEKITFPEGIAPIIINNSTYVPLRSVFDKMGVNVYWDQYKKNEILDAQSITCTKDTTIVQFTRTFNSSGSNVWTLTKWAGERSDSKNFTRINITDLQPTIIGNSSYIPLRVVSEAFGAEVGWIHEERVVDIVCDTQNPYKHDSTMIGEIEDFSLEDAEAYITSDFRNVVADTTPYFTEQSKFYKFTAIDTWQEVELRIYYRGFMDTPEPLTDDEEIIPAPAPTNKPTETEIPVTIDEPTETEAPAQTTEPIAENDV